MPGALDPVPFAERTAEHFGIEDVIDPRQTRPRLCRWITDAQRLLPDIAHERGRTMRP